MRNRCSEEKTEATLCGVLPHFLWPLHHTQHRFPATHSASRALFRALGLLSAARSRHVPRPPANKLLPTLSFSPCCGCSPFLLLRALLSGQSRSNPPLHFCFFFPLLTTFKRSGKKSRERTATVTGPGGGLISAAFRDS